MADRHVLPELCPVGQDDPTLAALQAQRGVWVDIVQLEPREGGEDEVTEDAAVLPLVFGQVLLAVGRQLWLFGELGVALVARVDRLVGVLLSYVLKRKKDHAKNAMVVPGAYIPNETIAIPGIP